MLNYLQPIWYRNRGRILMCFISSVFQKAACFPVKTGKNTNKICVHAESAGNRETVRALSCNAVWHCTNKGNEQTTLQIRDFNPTLQTPLLTSGCQPCHSQINSFKGKIWHKLLYLCQSFSFAFTGRSECFYMSISYVKHLTLKLALLMINQQTSLTWHSVITEHL